MRLLLFTFIVMLCLPSWGKEADFQSWMYQQGLTAMESKDFAKARLIFEQAIINDPQDSKGYVYIGRVAMGQKEYETAKKYFAIALSIDPVNTNSLLWSAKADIALKQWRDAEKKSSLVRKNCPSCKNLAALDQDIERLKRKEDEERDGLQHLKNPKIEK